VARHYKEDAKMPRLREPKHTSNRRANDTGCVSQRKDGRWICSVTMGDKSDVKPSLPPYNKPHHKPMTQAQL